MSGDVSNGDLWTRVDNLEEELKRYREGYKGCCYCCEPVAQLNIKLEKELKELRDVTNE